MFLRRERDFNAYLLTNSLILYLLPFFHIASSRRKEQAEITTPPYTFFWTRFSLPFISHTISIVANDEAGNNARQDLKALKFL